MIDAQLQSAIADHLSSAANPSAPDTGATPPLPEVSADDQARFQAALQTPPTDSAKGGVVVGALDAADTVARPSLGDTILQGVDNLRGETQTLADQTKALGENPDQLSLNEMFSLQMKVTQLTLGTQLISQVASKVQQDLNTLLKSS